MNNQNNAPELIKVLVEAKRIALKAISDMPGAESFTEEGREDDWRFRAKLARKEALDAAQAHITLAFDAALASREAPPAAPTDSTALVEHIRKMQSYVREYLEPGPYVSKHGKVETFNEPHKHQDEGHAFYMRTQMQAALLHDLIYMLDGPEERAALASREAPPAYQQEAVTVADHEAIEIGTISNYYGGLNLKREGGQDFWCIENWDGMDWEPCDPTVAAALRALKGGA